MNSLDYDLDYALATCPMSLEMDRTYDELATLLVIAHECTDHHPETVREREAELESMNIAQGHLYFASKGTDH